jgi:hypothetical protein
MTDPADRFEVLSGGRAAEDRDAQLAEGADEVVAHGGRSSLLGHERFLITVAASLMTLGICVILIGWWGAARSTILEEQVPYVISGGLLGVALTTIGALTLLSHWLTVGIREARAQDAARRQEHQELMAALRRLDGAPTGEEASGNGRARSARAERPVRRPPRRS